MSFSTASPARVSVVMDVVDNAKSMDWYSASEQLSPPTYLLSNDSLPESKEDDLVILGTHAVQCRFLDDEGKIELMGEKGPSDREVESEVDLEEAKEMVKDGVEEKEPDPVLGLPGATTRVKNGVGVETLNSWQMIPGAQLIR